jgi:ribosome-associated protein
VSTEEDRWIRLEDFLKVRGLVPSGGQAKLKIQGGQIQVNGAVETRRAKKLRAGDRVLVPGEPEATVGEDEVAPPRR